MTGRLILNCTAVHVVVIGRWDARFPRSIQVSAFCIIDMKLHRFAFYHIPWQSRLCMYMIYVSPHSCISFSSKVSTSYDIRTYFFLSILVLIFFIYFFFLSFFLSFTRISFHLQTLSDRDDLLLRFFYDYIGYLQNIVGICLLQLSNWNDWPNKRE